MKIEIFPVRKIYEGKVDVWDKVVDYCKRLNRKLIVDFEGQRMLIHNLDAYTYEGQCYVAQRDDKYMKMGDVYKLYRFVWAPVEQKHEEAQVFTFGNTDHIKRMLEIGRKLKLTSIGR